MKQQALSPVVTPRPLGWVIQHAWVGWPDSVPIARVTQRAARRVLCGLLLLAGLMSATGLAWADTVRAEVDRHQLAANETFVLRLIRDGAGGRGEPDLSPLEPDFEILGRSQGERMTVIGGVISHTRELSLELLPVRSGTLEIPPLTWDGVASDAIAITVAELAGPGAETDRPRPLFVVASVENAQPYVQQPFQYVVRIYFSEPLQRATLSDPVVVGASIERLGEDAGFSEMVDGERYQVIERRFLIVPFQSGSLEIRGPRLDAVMEQRGAQRSGADRDRLFAGAPFAGLTMVPPGRRLFERAADVEVTIRPQPDGASSPWLPAESLELTEEWVPTTPSFTVGEPVTRVVTLTARGLTAAQLPPLELAAVAGIQSYPDQVAVEDLPGQSAPVALQTLEVAMMPVQDGIFTLPEVRVPWWDTRTDEPRVAVIPARRIEVTAAPGADRDRAQAAGDALQPLEPTSSAGPGGGESAGSRQSQARLADWLWPGIAAVLAGGWLLTLVREKVWRGRGDAGDPRTRSLSGSPGHARGAIERACLVHDPRAARAALLEWARLQWGSAAPRGLAALGERLADAEAMRILLELDRQIYAERSELDRDGQDWDGPLAWRVLEPRLRALTAPVTSPESAVLPALYPSAR
ncbi:BatD family protein [Thiocapsa imhoffii]|nr:BatD family protein [Thiocapsa imhoffii]